jgi:hypothetical protein
MLSCPQGLRRKNGRKKENKMKDLKEERKNVGQE